MTLEYFLLLLMIVSIFTGLVTEGIKKLLEESKKTYKANFLAGGVAVVLSVLVGSGYIILMDAQINSHESSIPYCADPAFMAVCNGWI